MLLENVRCFDNVVRLVVQSILRLEGLYRSIKTLKRPFWLLYTFKSENASPVRELLESKECLEV